MTDKVFDNRLLKEVRIEEGLSQSQFAKKLGTSQQALALIENNKRGVPKSILGPLYEEYGLMYDKEGNLKRMCEKGENLEDLKKYTVNVSLDICASNENSAMTYLISAMSKTGKCLVSKIEIL